ncbi:hypothetical protein FG386_003030 [Cryptosporidium ryanae]|uniref:uncharacterized protein n=1 Tax=Cryptosporidium ryanae TaxID=515981 RepID=UPI00351A7709|nr:hypothetical protein FG386_003030 [Cryptosporidium ryanae]
MDVHESSVSFPSPFSKKEEQNNEFENIEFQSKGASNNDLNSNVNIRGIEENNINDNVKRRFPPNQFLKFSTLILVPGRPRKWRRVQRRAGKNEGAWLYKWEFIPESVDSIFMENLDLMARGVVGPRRTGRTTRAVSFHMREAVLGSGNMYELENNYDQYGSNIAPQNIIDSKVTT